MPPSTYYAVLLALVLGVGCGKGEELSPEEYSKRRLQRAFNETLAEAQKDDFLDAAQTA